MKSRKRLDFDVTSRFILVLGIDLEQIRSMTSSPGFDEVTALKALGFI